MARRNKLNLLKFMCKRTLNLIQNPHNQLNLSKSNLKLIGQTLKGKNLVDKSHNVKKRKSKSHKAVKRTKRKSTKSQLSKKCNQLPLKLRSFNLSQTKTMKTFGQHQRLQNLKLIKHLRISIQNPAQLNRQSLLPNKNQFRARPNPKSYSNKINNQLLQRRKRRRIMRTIK